MYVGQNQYHKLVTELSAWYHKLPDVVLVIRPGWEY